VVLQPLIGAAIFAFLSEVIAKTSTDGSPRFLFTFAGFIAWTAFSGTMTKVSTCLIQNSNLVSKIYFPRLILPLATVLSVLIDFAVGLVVLFVLMAFWHVLPTAAILLLPLWLLLMLMIALGVGLIAAGLTVQYRDVQFVLPVAVQFLLFISPVWYPRSAMPSKYHLFYDLNPLSGLLDAFRWSLLPSVQVNWGNIVYSSIFAVLVMFIGVYSFRNMERRFADVI
jgi:lipopolysaccharide transport system permease protein